MRKDDPGESPRALPPPRRGQAESGADRERRGSGVGFAVAMTLLTALGAGTGIGLGLTLGETRAPELARAEAPAGETAYGEGVSLVRLQPVVANLAQPADVWVRVDGALVLERMPQEEADRLAAEIAGDTMGWLRTLTLARLEGASGLAYLREDLSERARARSDGRVREFVVETLVVQ